MKSFNIVIYNNNSFYSILNELKDFFNFNLSCHIKEKNELINYFKENPKTLVISTEKITDDINNVFINKPIKLSALVEKINVALSKSSFKKQSNYELNKYSLDINSRFLIQNEKKLKLTEKEVEIILYLKNSKNEKTSQSLQEDIWKHSANVETHTVETHIYRLRKKINEKFNDNDFIINSKKGYKLKN